jgi:hypothetical protein
LRALDDGGAPDAVSARLAAAVTDLTVVDVLPHELAELQSCPLAMISAPIFDAAGTVVMSVSAQPYRHLTAEAVRDLGAQVAEFARTASTLIAHAAPSGRVDVNEGH